MAFFHGDHLGSGIGVTDGGGNSVSLFEYLPYGEKATETGTFPLKHKFTGQEEDTETGFYYFLARYYDPLTGSFLSVDPLLQDPHDPQALNPYSYVRRNPSNLTDPSGMCWFCDFVSSVVESVSSVVESVAQSIQSIAETVSSSFERFFAPEPDPIVIAWETRDPETSLLTGITQSIHFLGPPTPQPTFSLGFSLGGERNFSEDLSQIVAEGNHPALNQLKEAAARGPEPNLLSETSQPGAGPIFPGVSGQFALGRPALGMIPSQAFLPSLGVLMKAGNASRSGQKEKTGRKIKDIQKNPQDWEKVGEWPDPKQPKRGKSLRELLKNKRTGEVLARHILERNGKLAKNHPHYHEPKG